MSFVIYGLVDPETDLVRYVGFTSKSLSRRLSRHMADANIKVKTHKTNWINSLIKKGLKPSIVLIRETSPETWKEDEIRTIKEYREHGFNLVNQTDGGQGQLGFKQTKEQIKMAEAKRRITTDNYARLRGKKLLPEDIERLRIARLTDPRIMQEGYRKLSEQRKLAYIGENNPFFGKTHSLKSKVKVSSTKRKISEDTVNRINLLRSNGLSLSQIGREVSLPFQTVSKIVNKKFLYLKEAK